MGRGLSDLQQWILREAGKVPLLRYPAILIGYFGWDSQCESPCLVRRPFSLAAIGEQCYRKTMASLSRSCSRLEQRGMVICVRGMTRWSAVEITDAGREWLSVNRLP